MGCPFCLFSGGSSVTSERKVPTIFLDLGEILQRALEAGRKSGLSDAETLERLAAGLEAQRLKQEARDAEIAKMPLVQQGLVGYGDAGIRRVRIMSMRDKPVCETCFDADGRELSIEEALADPLPHKSCSNTACRCYYLPLVSIEPD